MNKTNCSPSARAINLQQPRVISTANDFANERALIVVAMSESESDSKSNLSSDSAEESVSEQKEKSRKSKHQKSQDKKKSKKEAKIHQSTRKILEDSESGEEELLLNWL